MRHIPEQSDDRRRLISLKAVCDRVPYSRTQLWRKWTNPDDDFPRPVSIGANRIAFFEDELDAWIKRRTRRGPEAPKPRAA